MVLGWGSANPALCCRAYFPWHAWGRAKGVKAKAALGLKHGPAVSPQPWGCCASPGASQLSPHQECKNPVVEWEPVLKALLHELRAARCCSWVRVHKTQTLLCKPEGNHCCFWTDYVHVVACKSDSGFSSSSLPLKQRVPRLGHVLHGITLAATLPQKLHQAFPSPMPCACRGALSTLFLCSLLCSIFNLHKGNMHYPAVSAHPRQTLLLSRAAT